jgi:hypothetical protein
MKKLLTAISVLAILVLIIIIYGRWLNETNVSKDNKLIISRKPDSTVFNMVKLDSMPKYNGNSTMPFERDLINYDPSGLDLNNNLIELLHSDFDSKTNWPKSLPDGFNPDSIRELGKNPGLNVRKLHELGITGKGVGIAIIDKALLVDHIEYREQLRMYEEIHGLRNERASMHGPAVASIAVGKTVGVAPEADLYYISSDDGTIFNRIKYILFKNRDINPKWRVKSIYRVLEINRTLPLDKKIRVLSISSGSYRRNFLKAIEDAGKEGLFVISSSLSYPHNLRFSGLGRDCLTDPDNILSYFPGSFWSNSFYKSPSNFKIDSTLLVPMDSRCTSSQSGKSSYVFYSMGGLSWSIPYIAGLYALACQVKPSVTPQEFWNKALETGDEIKIEKNNKVYKFGKIVNPVKLIETLKESII